MTFLAGHRVTVSRLTDGFEYEGTVTRVTPTGRVNVDLDGTRGKYVFRADGSGITDEFYALRRCDLEEEIESLGPFEGFDYQPRNA